MREAGSLDLRGTAKPHCPLRDSTAKPPLGRREANGRVIAMLRRPGKSRLEENSGTCGDLARRSLSAEASA